MKVIKYNKLIRDNIPEIIENSGKKAVVEKLTDEEYIEALNSKLGEELKEYIENGKVEELADIVEVIYAILDYKRISIDEFHRIRQNKNNNRGAFGKRLKLVEVIQN